MASEDFSFGASYRASFYIVPKTPNAKQIHSPNSDEVDFQFNGGDGFLTAASFESPTKKRGLHRCTQSMPSFADDLFRDGKVKALPLPPAGFRGPAAVASSPMSPRSPLSRMNSLWNDDFDPFVAALESVKEDNHRGRPIQEKLVDHHHQQQEKQLSIMAPKSPVQEKLVEPKGVDFSRRLRTLANNGDHGRKTKRQKLMRFLTVRSRSVVERDNNGGSKSMTGLLRKLSFNRSRLVSSSETTAAMASSTSRKDGSMAVTKVAVMHYKPSFLLCLGYGWRRSS